MENKKIRLTHTVTTGGCGSKLGAGDLAQALSHIPQMEDQNLLVGFDTSDDASVYQLTDELAIVNTVDYMPPIVDHPYTFGAVAATNALSDIYSMGSVPKTALNIVYWPKNQLEPEILGDILRGGAEKVKQAGAVIVGGHTVDAPQLMYGLAVTGIVHPKHIVRNNGAQPGDALILTKRLGVGIITTALKLDAIGDHVLPQIVESMTRLNGSASEVMLKYGVRACTDVTGFSLLGHAFEMAQASAVRLEIFAEKVPYFEEALELVSKGVETHACYHNYKFLENHVTFEPGVSVEMGRILIEAETSGGLLIALPEPNANDALKELHESVCPEAAVIGRVVASPEKQIHVY